MHCWQLSKFVSLIRQAERKVLQIQRSSFSAFRLFATKRNVENIFQMRCKKFSDWRHQRIQNGLVLYSDKKYMIVKKERMVDLYLSLLYIFWQKTTYVDYRLRKMWQMSHPKSNLLYKCFKKEKEFRPYDLQYFSNLTWKDFHWLRNQELWDTSVPRDSFNVFYWFHFKPGKAQNEISKSVAPLDREIGTEFSYF